MGLEINKLMKDVLGVTHIVHLAGAGIAEKRGHKKKKNTIVKSRVLTTRLLHSKIKSNNHKKRHLSLLLLLDIMELNFLKSYLVKQTLHMKILWELL